MSSVIAQTLEGLRQDLGGFVDRIKNIHPRQYTSSVRQNLFEEYRLLHDLFKVVDTSQLEDVFNEDERAAAKYLALGIGSLPQFDATIDGLLARFAKREDPLPALMEFLNSRRGFEAINGSATFDAFGKAELEGLFGSMFGARIAAQCVKAFKTESVAKVVAYALSGLYVTRDKAELNALTDESDAFVEALRKRIQCSDVECVFYFSELEGYPITSVACSIHEDHWLEMGQTRASKDRLDHCVVNKDLKRIVIGQSTSAKNTAGQRNSLIKGYLAVSHMVKQEFLEGHRRNPYFGFHVEAFFLSAGRFVASAPENGIMEQGWNIKDMLSNASLEELTAVAKLAYYRLFANATSEEQTVDMLAINPMLAGCNTLAEYEWSKSLAESQESANDKALAVRKHLCGYLSGVVSTIASGSPSFVKQGKNDLLLALDDVLALGESLVHNYRSPWSEEDYAGYVRPLCDQVERLVDVLASRRSEMANQMVDRLHRLSLDMSTLERCNRVLKEGWREDPRKLVSMGSEPVTQNRPDDMAVDYTKMAEEVLAMARRLVLKYPKRFGADYFVKKYLPNLARRYNLPEPDIRPHHHMGDKRAVDVAGGVVRWPAVKEFVDNTKFLVNTLDPKELRKGAGQCRDYLFRLTHPQEAVLEIEGGGTRSFC